MLNTTQKITLAGVIAAVVSAFSEIISIPNISQPNPTTYYQVRVLSATKGQPLQNARVTLELGGRFMPIDERTDSNGLARILLLLEHTGQPGRVIVEANGYNTYTQNISIEAQQPPKIILLTGVDEGIGNTGIPSRVKPTSPARFECDGRTRCSEMTSCEEARFFVRNCPGAERMDGDNDRTPCEREWCR